MLIGKSSCVYWQIPNWTTRVSAQSFCSFSNNNNIDTLFELEQKNNDIIKSIVVQDALCKENQQKLINALCESLKIEITTFQKYQKNFFLSS